MTLLSSSYLRQLFHYDPDTGLFVRTTTRSHNAAAGMVAGAKRKDGRKQISINGRLYLTSRLAWLYMTGEWPKKQIDHRNLNRADDVFSNLREASPWQNTVNRSVQRNNTSGLKGAYLDRRVGRKYFSSINTKKGKLWLGSFDTAEEAHAAYVAAAKIYHGEFARPQ